MQKLFRKEKFFQRNLKNIVNFMVFASSRFSSLSLVKRYYIVSVIFLL